MINGVPHLEGLDPPFSRASARYYAYLQCPLCCSIQSNTEPKKELGWFAAVSSVTYESSDSHSCAYYAVSWASYFIIILRLLWIKVCLKYLHAFLSRVNSNLAIDSAVISSERAACVQIDDISPLAHLSDAQIIE
jgi:hypothetical protein